MKKYFGWIFAIVTCTSLSAFAQDNDEADKADNDKKDEVVVNLEEVDDSKN